MTLRFQRLLTILISLILISGALVLILTNSQKNIIFFYTPTELANSNKEINQNIRIGGFVKKESIKKIANTDNDITFIITDNTNEIYVNYRGILPNLFREGQGAVAEGVLIEKNIIDATKIFAKHDENYMPASIKKQLEKSDYWKKNYNKKNLPTEKIPEFNSQNLKNNNITLSKNDIIDKITLINFFASWCVPCKTEHHLLMDLRNNFPELDMIGFNHKDNKEDAIQFLLINGNPYSFVGLDLDGNIGLDFGVFGLPETFLTDNQGNIIYKHTGPLTKEVIQREILPNL